MKISFNGEPESRKSFFQIVLKMSQRENKLLFLATKEKRNNNTSFFTGKSRMGTFTLCSSNAVSKVYPQGYR